MRIVRIWAILGLVISSLSWADSVSKPVPVLLVRGMLTGNSILDPVKRRLEAKGFIVDYALYQCRVGETSLIGAAKEIEISAKKLMEETKSDQVDVIGFSLGAIAARYFIQRLDGKKMVRKFISIAGPHHGTYLAYVAPFLVGIREMMPGSAFINDLNADMHPWGPVEVYSLYTPYDAIVIPAHHSILPHSHHVKKFQVTFHHQMIKDKEVLDYVADVLKQPYRP